jgi:transcriptional regulator with XRE-family HTH domain
VYDERIGARIKELREIKGWSRKELGKRTGSNPNAVGRDERGGAIGTKRILKYAQAFGVEPELILEVLDEEEDE